MGDPAGIGPEIIAKSLLDPLIAELACYVVVGDEGVVAAAFRDTGCDAPCFNGIDPEADSCDVSEDAVNIIDPGSPLEDMTPGVPTREGAEKALDSIKLTAEILKDGGTPSIQGMVTAPVSKSEIARVDKSFVGHTEYLRDFFGASSITMVLTGKTLCVAPVTRHIPVKEIHAKLTAEVIIENVKNVIGNRGILSDKDEPVIGVCALNPHAGEGGKMGSEEIEIISPCIERLRSMYSNILGPVPADVAFYKALKGHIDIVVAMYHDQGLGPFKMIDFEEGVNMTLGLSHVRTSPDHGTAFDIAGKGIASPNSMKAAIRLAVKAVRNNG